MMKLLVTTRPQSGYILKVPIDLPINGDLGACDMILVTLTHMTFLTRETVT